MPRGKKGSGSGTYFGTNEEAAVVAFLSSEDVNERNEIYNRSLRRAFDKMVESIIRKYKLHRKNETFEDLHADTLSFLMTKASKFKPENNTKAYSYYGTIAKNYLLCMLIKDDKKMKQELSYEDHYDEFDDKLDLSYNMKAPDVQRSDLMESILGGIRSVLEAGCFENIDDETVVIDDDEYVPATIKMTDNERKVGEMLLEILGNYNIATETMSNGSKCNKLTVMSMLKESTNLPTKEIRLALNHYRSLYFLTREEDDKEENEFL